ncbi:MAG: histidine phosphatase family protein [Mycetocola sp.]
MPANRIHLVRHGEVHNPEHVLYGRLEGFRLSERGRLMTRAAADELIAAGDPVRTLIVSPLQRTQESAEPIAESFRLEPTIDERVIEPSNFFEGTQIRRALRNPINWLVLRRPSVPSWGEPYTSIVDRMMAAITDAWEAADGGDVAIVSHQLPIWMVHRHVNGLPLKHDPRERRCALSSITTLERSGDAFVEVGYRDPAAALAADSVDVGAV